MKVKLSITIVAYQNYGDIQNAIKTIEKHTDNSVSKKIYIVDNTDKESEHNTKLLDVFMNFISRYKDVEYIDADENLGFGRGHNFVLNRLDSKYHAIVNPDILLEDDAFSAILDYMDDNDDVGMCIPNITDNEGNRLPVYRKDLTIVDMFIRMFCGNWFRERQNSHTLQEMDYSRPFQVPFGQGSFLVIRTDLFNDLQGFDDTYFMYLEDADLCKRVNQNSKLMYFPDASVIHKWEKGSHKSMKLFKAHLQSAFYYFKKWGIKLF